MGRPRWELCIGIHSGSVIAGNSGDSFDIWGDAVNIAARMESSGETGKIHITEKTADYLEGQGKLTSRGDIDLKNKGTCRPSSWKICPESFDSDFLEYWSRFLKNQASGFPPL